MDGTRYWLSWVGFFDMYEWKNDCNNFCLFVILLEESYYETVQAFHDLIPHIPSFGDDQVYCLLPKDTLFTVQYFIQE